MIIEANRADGSGVVNAHRMLRESWLDLQRTYTVGELVMPCCSAPAVPKISANGYPFFAHASGTCGTSEESHWHLAAKQVVRVALEELGLTAVLEEPGRSDESRWQADVWVDQGEVQLAVELQRSYQSLRDYRDRQERYRAAGVRAVWLAREDRYSTLVRSMGKERLRSEFGGRFPASGHISPCLPDIPVARLALEPAALVTGAGFFTATLPDFLRAVLEGRFVWIDGLWCIDNLEAMQAAAASERNKNMALAATRRNRR
jgi:competence protein CoiA